MIMLIFIEQKFVNIGDVLQNSLMKCVAIENYS